MFVDRGRGVFEPRLVKVGGRTADYAVIFSGLRAGESVVTRANFLIDSESNLRQSIEGMTGMPGMSGTTHEDHNATRPAAKAPAPHAMPGTPAMQEEGKPHDSSHH